MDSDKGQLRRQKTLNRLAGKLTARPMTAKQVSRAMRCTKATAYAWIRLLPDLGFKLLEHKAAGPSGPPATVYSIAGGQK